MSNAPRVRVAPKADDTFGDLAADLASDYGLAPDDWQQIVLDDWLAESGGRWSSLTCGLSAPRQQGKNAALEVRELFGMVGRGEKILHTAHQVTTAQKHFRRLKHFFGKKVNDPTAKFPELNALVSELRNVNGQEAIYLANGASVEIVARSQGSGRDFTVDTIVCDEAQDMSDDDLEALLSTSSAPPGRNPQWFSPAPRPGPKSNGEVFTRVRDEALGEAPERICWHEWSCEKGVDLDSREAWLQANPALGTRLQLDVIRGERARFSDEGFMRERLGMWPAKGSRKAVISPDLWARQTISEAGAPEESAKVSALGLDMSPDRIIAVSGCWVRGENSHVELLAFDQAADTLGAVRFIAERAGRRIPVVIDGVSPAASMVPALKDLRVKVIVTSAQDMGRACGMFYDDLAAGRITHCSQQQLDDAVTGAGKREIRDAGMWAWDRRSLEVNIAPLVSATLARFGAAVTPRPTGAGRTVGDRSSSGRVGTVS